MTRQIEDAITLAGEEGALHRAAPLATIIRRQALPACGRGSTAVSRGYVARWALEGERLLLADILDPHLEPWPAARERLLPNASPPIPATWFNGRLTVALGERVGWLGSFAAERELYLWIVEGRVVRRRALRPGRATLCWRALIHAGRAALFLAVFYGPLLWLLCGRP